MARDTITKRLRASTALAFSTLTLVARAALAQGGPPPPTNPPAASVPTAPSAPPAGQPPAAGTAPDPNSTPQPAPVPPPPPPTPSASPAGSGEAPVVLSGPPGTYSVPSQPSAPAPPYGPAAYPPPREKLPDCESSGKPSPCVQPHDAYRHDGFYLRSGGGFDYLALSGNGPDGGASVSGMSMGALIAIGGNVGDGLVVAGAIHVGQTRNDFEGAPARTPGKATAAAGQLGVLVDWFPDPTGGWHVGGLAGLGFVGLSETVIEQSTGGGFGGALLGGYDWWIGPQWSLGLYAVASATTSAKLRDRDASENGYEFASWSLGLNYSFTLH